MRSFRKLTEAKETVVFGFGRFNPPTTGHEKLIEKVASVAGSNPFFIYPSHTTGPKDPLPHAKKVAWMRKMFPKYKKNIIADRNAKTAIQIAEKLHKDGYKNLIMVAGSDRLKEFEALLTRYNDAPDKKGNQLFKFDSVKVISAGERDPDAEGVSGMSASKMRAAAEKGDFDSFKTGIPATLGDADKKKLYFEVRKNMGIREEREMGNDYDSLRDAYLTGKIWNVGEVVEAKGNRGEVVRKGTNYLSFVTEDGKVHKAWLHEINWDKSPTYNDPLVSVEDSKGQLVMHALLSTAHGYWKLKEFSKNKKVLIKKIHKAGAEVKVTVGNAARPPGHMNHPNPMGSILTITLSPHHKKQVVEEEITKRDLDQIEIYADRIFAKVGIDVTFTRHFLDRVNDARNKKDITTSELTRLFKQSFKKYGKKIAQLGPDAEAVINDMKTDINMPFVLNLKGQELELVAKTVMRKKNFKTSGPKLSFEDLVGGKQMSGPTGQIFALKSEEVELDERNYALEYQNYGGRPEQIARRSSRNKARRAMGDKAVKGMDVGHKDNNPLNNDPKNLRNEDPSKNRREPRLREKRDAGWPDDSVKIGKKHYTMYKDRGNWWANEVDKKGNTIGDGIFDTSKRELVKILAKETLDELWYNNVMTKISQISHPSSWDKIAKEYAAGMKDPEHRKYPSAWAQDVAKQYGGITSRDLIKYINGLVDDGKLPKELKAEVQYESFKSFVDQIRVQEVLGSGASQKDYIDDFIDSDAPQFKGKSKKDRITMAIAAFRSNS